MKYGAPGEWGMPTGPVPLFLAPMAGVTDLAYRLLASECGADFTMTEFTAASGLSRREAKSWLKFEPRLVVTFYRFLKVWGGFWERFGTPLAFLG